VPVDEHTRVREQRARVERDRKSLLARRQATLEVTSKRNLTDRDARFMPSQRDNWSCGWRCARAG
jgi:hypothetical protein